MIESRNRKPLVKQASTLIRSSSISAVEMAKKFSDGLESSLLVFPAYAHTISL
ncbi:hypothetical protein [Nostoc sp. 'Peltigera membranacea cyanobiont' 213]|uniref:hypothetical protein n=1 Tax=Nostoc sp. 'Peltigera membranacea cyanobiont' 213 TaxID=2014530 RepID=UPI00167DC0C7|nr:hypothetical protein [Nostoc sp. 'Peltigera membranacea cyanobiont' 213]